MGTSLIQNTGHPPTYEQILVGIIGAADFYLIRLVLIIFTFGIYELFISEIDIARVEGGFGSILDTENLDDLKNKIIKVIIMVLIVTFFQRILSMEFTTSIDMLAMAFSICLICAGVYFLGKHGHKNFFPCFFFADDFCPYYDLTEGSPFTFLCETGPGVRFVSKKRLGYIIFPDIRRTRYG